MQIFLDFGGKKSAEMGSHEAKASHLGYWVCGEGGEGELED